jgi:hypothetical protein
MKRAPSSSMLERKAMRGKVVVPSVPEPRAPKPTDWHKSKMKTEDIQALVDGGFLRQQLVDRWNTAAGNRHVMEKNPDEIPQFAPFCERGLALSTSDFFRGVLHHWDLEHTHLNPNSMFHLSVYVHFCEAFVGVKPHWGLFRKIVRLKPQPSIADPAVVGGAGLQMREKMDNMYLKYELVASNTDWKNRWFYYANHAPQVPKITMRPRSTARSGTRSPPPTSAARSRCCKPGSRSSENSGSPPRGSPSCS